LTELHVFFPTPVKPNFITAATKLQRYFKTSSVSPTQRKKNERKTALRPRITKGTYPKRTTKTPATALLQHSKPSLKAQNG